MLLVVEVVSGAVVFSSSSRGSPSLRQVMLDCPWKEMKAFGLEGLIESCSGCRGTWKFFVKWVRAESSSLEWRESWLQIGWLFFSRRGCSLQRWCEGGGKGSRWLLQLHFSFPMH